MEPVTLEIQDVLGGLSNQLTYLARVYLMIEVLRKSYHCFKSVNLSC